MSASADVLAMAKVEVDLNAIPEGKNVSPPEPAHLFIAWEIFFFFFFFFFFGC